jgi:hypothetical protein
MQSATKTTVWDGGTKLAHKIFAEDEFEPVN